MMNNKNKILTDKALKALNTLLSKNILNDFGNMLRHIITAIEISLSTKSSDDVLKFLKILYPDFGLLSEKQFRKESILQSAYSTLFFMTIELKLSDDQKQSLMQCFVDLKNSEHYAREKDSSKFTIHFYESDLLLWDIRYNNMGLFLIMWEVEKICFEKFVNTTLDSLKMYKNNDYIKI